MKDWRNTLVSPDATILEAIEVIDRGGLQIALVVDSEMDLKGTVTDGDVRRGILKGVSLDKPVTGVMNANPKVALTSESREVILQRMTSFSLHHIPVVDTGNKVVKIELIEDLINAPSFDNEVVLIAGGMGTRLKPLTDNYPKPLLKVGTKPIMETIIESFIENGFTTFHISVNYRSDLIEDYFGNGSKWGVKIDYVHEEKRMGTAGSLALLPERPRKPFFVMNADLLTKVNFQHLLNFHRESGAMATMCVRQFEFQVPYGVVNINDDRLVNIQEKPVQQYFINAGIYVMEPGVIDYIPKGEYFDMPMLFDKLVADKKEVSVFPIREYWLDIGHKTDFDRAQEEFGGIFG